VTDPTGVRDVRLCILGFGNVTQRLCDVLSDRTELLEEKFGMRVLVTAVGTGRHGSFADSVGAPPHEVLDAYRSGEAGFDQTRVESGDLIATSGADVLVESSPLERGGHTAIRHLELAFDQGLDVITVNKGPIAWDYRRLQEYAAARNCRLRFEGVTMDGCPVYNLAEFCLPGDRIIGFRGVLNSTTNYILDAMVKGATLSDALAKAQAEGICEADPANDIDGHDAAAKVAALANVLLDADITPDSVAHDSIRDLGSEDVASAAAGGERLRVICAAEAGPDGSLRASAKLQAVGSDDPMYAISGTSSALVLETELAGKVEIVERDGLLTQTAYAIYADLITLYGHPST
jgi:homoserine dehydrogenase